MTATLDRAAARSIAAQKAAATRRARAGLAPAPRPEVRAPRSAAARSAAAQKAVATRRARAGLGPIVRPVPVTRPAPTGSLRISAGTWEDGAGRCPRDCKDCARVRTLAAVALKPVQMYLGPKPLPVSRNVSAYQMPAVGTRPTPPAAIMKRGIASRAKRRWAGLDATAWVDEDRLAWDYWHAGIPNAPAFPSDERLAEQRAALMDPDA